MVQGYLRYWSARALPVLAIGLLLVVLGFGMMPPDEAGADVHAPVATTGLPATYDGP